MTSTVTARRLLVLAFLGASSASAQERVPNLPTTMPPKQALGVADKHGKLTITMAVSPHYQLRTVNDPKTGGFIMSYVMVTSVVLRLEPALYEAYDTKGGTIAVKRLRKLLRDETVVLVSEDGKPVDPLHLRVYKEDLIVLVLLTPPGPPSSPPPTISTNPPLPPAPLPPPSFVPSTISPKPPLPPAPLPVFVPQAQLKVEIIAPKAGVVDVPVSYVIRLTNQGTATADKLVLHALFDQRLEHERKPEKINQLGRNELRTTIAPLKAGETRDEVLMLTPRRVGSLPLEISAFAADMVQYVSLHVLVVELSKTPPRAASKSK